jgi:hypothetical protein
MIVLTPLIDNSINMINIVCPANLTVNPIVKAINEGKSDDEILRILNLSELAAKYVCIFYGNVSDYREKLIADIRESMSNPMANSRFNLLEDQYEFCIG